jgi:hypothetical protein
MSESTSFKPITAREALERQNSYQKITTGSPELDSLVGGISEGTSYLFYGDHDSLSTLVHQMLVMCSAPQDKGGFDSKAFYFNNTDYYTARTTLSPTRLGEFAKKLGIEPTTVFQKVQVTAAYNEERQKLVCEEMVRALSTASEDSRLVVLHNATCFLPDTTNFTKSLQGLTYVIGKLKEVCSQKRALVVTASQFGNPNSRRIPKTMGGSFFQALNECDGSSSQMEGWDNTLCQSDSGETSRIRERSISHPQCG